MNIKHLILLVLTCAVVYMGYETYQDKVAKINNEAVAEAPSVPKLPPIKTEPPKAPQQPDMKPQPLLLDTGKEYPYKEAIERAKRSGKNILVVFHADWCHWCHKLDDDTIKNHKVQEVLEDYYLVRVNTDENRELTRKYSVRGLPCYFVIDGDEKILNRGSGYKKPDQFIAWLG